MSGQAQAPSRRRRGRARCLSRPSLNQARTHSSRSGPCDNRARAGASAPTSNAAASSVRPRASATCREPEHAPTTASARPDDDGEENLGSPEAGRRRRRRRRARASCRACRQETDRRSVRVACAEVRRRRSPSPIEVEEVPRRAQHDSGGDGRQGQTSSRRPGGRGKHERDDAWVRRGRLLNFVASASPSARAPSAGSCASRTGEEEDRGEKEGRDEEVVQHPPPRGAGRPGGTTKTSRRVRRPAAREARDGGPAGRRRARTCPERGVLRQGGEALGARERPWRDRGRSRRPADCR